jgi:hypothetical protein
MAPSFNVIAAPELNPTPVAVNVKDALPAVTAGGEMEVSFKELPVMVKVSGPEVVLSGFITRMPTFPGAAICAAVTFAVSWVADETVVESDAPFQRIVVPLMKFVPVAVRTKSALPAPTDAGESDARVGGRTPLNPPHPHRNRDATAKSRMRRIRDQLIAYVYASSGGSNPACALRGISTCRARQLVFAASYDGFLKCDTFLQITSWPGTDERTNEWETSIVLIYPNHLS